MSSVLSLFIYIIIVYIALLLMYLGNYKSVSLKQSVNIHGDNETIGKSDIGIKLFVLILITLILSLYSAYLAVSGSLSDTVRYAWSFTYRYPLQYESLTALLDSETEFGFLLLLKIIKFFVNDNFWIFFIISFITTFINLYVAFKISKRHLFIVFLYLISMYFFQSTYLLRQTLAVSFGNLALLSLFRGMNFRYFVFVFVALSFHATAIILIPMYFVLKSVKSTKGYLLIMLISIFIFVTFSSTITSTIENIPYLEKHFNSDGILEGSKGTISTIFKGIPFYFITILALINRNKILKIDNKSNFYIISSILYSLSFMFSSKMYWLFRMGWYFLIPTLALIPIVISTYNNRNKRNLYFITIILLFLIITGRQIYITLN